MTINFDPQELARLVFLLEIEELRIRHQLKRQAFPVEADQQALAVIQAALRKCKGALP